MYIMQLSIVLLVALLGASVSHNWFRIQQFEHHDVSAHHMGHEMDIESHRLAYLEHKEHIQKELLHEGDYACCLEKPCTYCIEKTPKHGEGATCTCLSDIMNGVHPCGECIGEILEGHGNKYLKDQFAPAIAEEVGEEHLETIQKIIEEKYAE
jgi:hypothetical protein